MPYLELKTNNPDVSIGIWRIEESEPYFMTRLNLYENEQTRLSRINNGQKRLEWLSSRLCLKNLLKIRHKVESLNNPEGRPYLSDNSHHISYSHSHGYAAAVASHKHEVAIDIELFSKKYNPELSHKFMDKRELEYFQKHKDPHFFYLIWSAKETLFKIQGKKGVSLRQHIHIQIEDFSLRQNGKITGYIETENTKRYYEISYEIFSDFVLTYTHNSLSEGKRAVAR
ncbi:MAG: 4'-phosphopantetheinyl transferase family protein [Bacteroidia bacterium]